MMIIDTGLNHNVCSVFRHVLRNPEFCEFLTIAGILDLRLLSCKLVTNLGKHDFRNEYLKLHQLLVGISGYLSVH